jgi:CheY-like chemotaxis protein
MEGTMPTDPDRLLRLASEVAALRSEVDGLRDRIAQLIGGAEMLGADLAQTAQASVVVAGQVKGLSKRIEEELRRARGMRNIVFVVDHDAEARGLATDALSSAGYAVQGFARADDLIQILPLAVPRAVLIDLTIPGMSGAVLAEYLRTNPRTARVRRLGMTGFVPSASEARSFTSLIEKPLEPAALIDFVRNSLQRAPTTSPLAR